MGQVLLAELTVRTDSVGSTTTLRYTSGKEYVGFGAPGYYAPVVHKFLNLRRDAFGDGTTSGDIKVGGGVLELVNNDGQLDALIDYGFDGGEACFLLVDDESSAYSSAEELLVGTMEQPEFTFDAVKVRVRDRREETEVPLQTTLYAGTNSGATGVEGLANDLKGRPKPDAIGYVFNALLPVANDQKHIYQIDSVRANDVPAVFDGGVALTKGTARTSLSALQNNNPAAGQYDYYLGADVEGGAYIRLGTTAQYAITADIEGQSRSGTFRTLPGDLYQEYLTQRAGVDAGDVSSADVSAVNIAAPYDLGKWIDEQTTVHNVLDLIAASIPGWWGPDRIGEFRLKKLEDPSSSSAALTFKVFDLNTRAKASDGDVVSIQRITTNDTGHGVPAYQVTVLYKEFAHIQPDGLDVNITLARRSESSKQWRVAVATDNTVKDKHPLAEALEFETALTVEADAQAVADHLLDLYGVRRDRYRLTVRLTKDLISTVDLGTIVKLEFDRFGLASGQNFVVLGLRYRGVDEDDVSEVIDLDIWG